MTDYIQCKVCGTRLRAENEGPHMHRVHPNVPFANRPRSKHSFYLTMRTKRVAFAVVLVVVFAVAAAMIFRSVERTLPVEPGATVVRASMSGFDPNTISVKAGTPLKINLINMDNQYHTDGGGWHNFAMDDFGINVTVEPLGQKVFAVPTDVPGTYGWYCSMCCGGRESPSMNGRLIVEP